MAGICFGKIVRCVLLLVFAASLADSVAFAAASDDKFAIGQEPGWVERINPDQVPRSATITNESTLFLLVDYQVNVAAESLFVHVVKELRTPDAVQEGSSVSVDFDPEYQSLRWHALEVVRNGLVISQLQRGAFRLLQRESELERHLLDGSVSAVVALKDVRIGDQIRYSYTIQGVNPVFGGRYCDTFNYGWSSRVLRERIRFVCPTNRTLRFKAVGGMAEPTRTEANGTNWFVYDWRNLEPVQAEDRMPPWQVAYPWIDVSEFDGWAEVAQWASVLYPRTRLSPETEKLVAEWEAQFKEPAMRLQTALDHVQQQIRYLGLELGASSHRPSSPEVVAARGFGDCKDKTYLLCTILERMGIPAQPLLVDTGLRRGIAQRLPSPLAFNHVVAMVQINGRTVVVDPTASDQRGPVLDRRIREYGLGLVVDAAEKDLRTLPEQQAKGSETEIRETYTVGAIGQPAELEVLTISTGAAADRTRSDFSGRRPEEVSKDYLNYYARFHEGIEATASLRMEDDTVGNIVRVWEKYRIRDFWQPTPDGRYHQCEVYPGVLTSEFIEPETRLRRFSLFQPHPRRVRQSISLVFSSTWNLTSESSGFTNAGFSLASRRTAQPTRLDLEYDYVTLTNEISAREVADYLASVKKIRDALGYSLSLPTPGASPESSAPHFLLVIIGCLTSVILAAASVFVYRRVAAAGRGLPPDLRPVSFEDEKLRGLGGWLIFIALALCLRPLGLVKAIFESAPAMSAESWISLTSPTSDAYHALWGPYIVFILVGNLTLLCLGLLLAVFFFQRRRIFPKAFIAILLIDLAFTLVEIYFTREITSEADQDLVRYLPKRVVGCLIWIPYMLVSRRVRLTFTR